MTFRLKFPFTLVETQTGRIAGCSSCGSMWKSTISILSAVPLPKFMVVNWRFRWRSPRLNNCNNPDGEKVDNLMKILWYDYGKKLWYLRTVTLHNPEMYCHIFEGHSHSENTAIGCISVGTPHGNPSSCIAPRLSDESTIPYKGRHNQPWLYIWL